MHKYEAMFIVKPDLSEEEKNNLFNQITEFVAKNKGKVESSAVWAEKRRLAFAIKRNSEGIFYLMNFSSAPEAVAKLRSGYNLNENILRVLITRIDEKLI